MKLSNIYAVAGFGLNQWEIEEMAIVRFRTLGNKQKEKYCSSGGWIRFSAGEDPVEGAVAPDDLENYRVRKDLVRNVVFIDLPPFGWHEKACE